MTSVTPRPPATPRQPGTPRSSGKFSNLDARTIGVIVDSLKDRIYQRSFNLRKTFRQFDSEGRGHVAYDTFVTEMVRAHQLSDVEVHVLRNLLVQADFNKDGFIDFREFCAMLKMTDTMIDPTLSEQEKKRFQARGLIDPRMQKMVVMNPNRSIKIKSGVPTNELGHMGIDCPFGVLGDSERMDAVITSFLDMKYDNLRAVFDRFDADKDGVVTWKEFREGMKTLDKYVFDDEVDALLHVLDKKKKGCVNVDEFIQGIGQEYLKKKAHRSNAYASPFVWEEPEVVARTPRGTAIQKSGKKLKKANQTRASELRAVDARTRLKELFKREDEEMNANRHHTIIRPPGHTSTPRMPNIYAHSPRAGHAQLRAQDAGVPAPPPRE